MSARVLVAALPLLANLVFAAIVIALSGDLPVLVMLVAIGSASAGVGIAGVHLADALYVAPARQLPPPEQCSTGIYSGFYGPPERCVYPALHGHPEECSL